MEYAAGALALVLGIACYLTFLSAQRWRRRCEEFEKAAKSGPPSYECQQLLHDLTEGAALVKVTRISPMDVFIRRS